MKNQFFFAMVPVMALLTGCPTGPGDGLGEGEGEGEVGEGEGEGEPFAATLDMTFPNQVSGVLVNDENDPCLDLTAHTFEISEPGSYEVKPTPTDLNRRCVAQGIDVEESGSYQMDWGGKCGPFANDVYESGGGTIVDVTTTDIGPELRITGTPLFASFFVLTVDDDGTFGGEGDDVGGNHTIVTGTISDDLCVITYHQENDDGTVKDFVLNSQDTSCAG